MEILENRQLLAVWSVAENDAYFGTLNQHSLEYAYPQFGSGDNNIACGPSAALNSLVYLQNAFPSLFSQSLIAAAGHSMQGSGTYTTYDDWIYTAGGILADAQLMNTTYTDGTYHDNLIMGLYHYTQSIDPGTLLYSAKDHWLPEYWGDPPADAESPSWVESGNPTWDYIYDALTDSAAVITEIHYVGGDGHFMSVEGITWNDATNSGTISFMDPWVGSSTTVDARWKDGKIYLDYDGVNAAWIALVDVLAPVQIPAVPSNVHAVADGEQAITVQWDAVEDAGEYRLDRWNVSTAAWECIYAGAATQYADSGSPLQAGVTYSYRVCAANAAGDSAYSNAVSIATVPSAPSGFAATFTDIRTIALRWNAVVGASSYTLERAYSAEGIYSPLYNGTETHFTDTIQAFSLHPAYYYRVRASNALSNSNYSPSVLIAGLNPSPQPITTPSSYVLPDIFYRQSAVNGENAFTGHVPTSIPPLSSEAWSQYYSLFAGASSRIILSLLYMPNSGGGPEQIPSENDIAPDSILPAESGNDDDKATKTTVTTNALRHDAKTRRLASNAVVDQIMTALEATAEDDSEPLAPRKRTERSESS